MLCVLGCGNVPVMDTQQAPDGAQEKIRGEVRAQMARAGTTIPALAKRIGRTEKWVRSRVGPSAHVALTVPDLQEIARGLGAEFTYRLTHPDGVVTR